MPELPRGRLFTAQEGGGEGEREWDTLFIGGGGCPLFRFPWVILCVVGGMLFREANLLRLTD